MRDERDPWQAEADAAEIAESDYEVAFAAELPAELAHHGVIADADVAFEAEFFDWLDGLSQESVVLLVLEQCCAESVSTGTSAAAIELPDGGKIPKSELHCRHVTVSGPRRHDGHSASKFRQRALRHDHVQCRVHLEGYCHAAGQPPQ